MANKKLIYCKSCGAEIAKSAKACPQCGAKNKRKRPIIWVFLGLLILFMMIGISGSNDEPKQIGTVSAAQIDNKEPVKTTFEVGEKAELKDVVVTLMNVEESIGSRFNQPTDGNVFVLCEFEIENNSSSEIAVSSMASFAAYCDDYALNYSLPALMEKGDKPQLDGQVAAGKKMNGVIGYEVPADWNELEIRFTPDFWSGKEIVFTAYHE